MEHDQAVSTSCRLGLVVTLVLVLIVCAALVACQSANTSADWNESPLQRPTLLGVAATAPTSTPVTLPPASGFPGLPKVPGRVSLNTNFPSQPEALAVDPTSGELCVAGDPTLYGWLAQLLCNWRPNCFKWPKHEFSGKGDSCTFLRPFT